MGLRQHITRKLLSRRSAARQLALVAVLALIIGADIARSLILTSIAATYVPQRLVCPADKNVAHTHESRCYDADGNLVCPLEERPLHTHDASCYDETGALVCGLDELTEEHVHGAGCFVAVSADEDFEATPPVPGVMVSPASYVTGTGSPAQEFAGTVDATGNGSLEVHAIAPQGALPTGSFMRLTGVDDGELDQTVGQALSQECPGEVTGIHAIDITFLDAQGNEIEPSRGVTVTMSSPLVAHGGRPMVVHVADDGRAEIIHQLSQEQVHRRGLQLKSDEVALDAKSFSRYAIVIMSLEHELTASDGKTYRVTVDSAMDAGIPEDATLQVKEYAQFGRVWSRYADRASALLDDQGEHVDLDATRVFNISIVTPDGKEVQPTSPVSIRMELVDGEVPTGELSVVHFGNDGTEVLDASARGDTVSFETDGFSIYALVGTTLEKSVLASDGRNYRMSVTFGPGAGIPEGAELNVREILSNSTREYNNYLSQVEDVLGWESGTTSYARFFDITIVKDGKEIQPKDGSIVSVDIRLDDKAYDIEPQVVHFGDEPEVLDASTEGKTVSFEAAGFSVYAIVDAPPPVEDSGWQKITSVEQLAEMGSAGLYVGHVSGYYFTNEQYNVNASRTGIRKTKPATTNPADTTAVKYYFELIDGTSDQFYVYCYNDDETERKYVRQNSNSLSFVGANQATAFTVSNFPGAENTFRLLGSNGYYWNMQGNAAGNGFAAYNSATDTNARIKFEYHFEVPDDPYALDGQTFGIAYHNGTVSGTALTAASKAIGSAQGLAGEDLLVRPDILDHTDMLLVAPGSDLATWTFESAGSNKYHLTTVVDGITKYLTINGANVTLADEPHPVFSLINVTPGTGANAGLYHFTVNGYTLNYNASSAGFNAISGSNATTWLSTVKKSDKLDDDDFTPYTARKVSVSDTESVPNGKQLVMYTRIWNENTLEYEFYLVDYDGTLVRCYASGDVVQWVGSQVNTALWNLTEYHNADGTPNYYYELQNAYSGQYVAPQLKGGQILSNKKIGINLNGRRYGDDYTTVIAWDDPYYEYVGLKAVDGHVVSCPLAEAEDFYFAIVEIPEERKLTEVSTLDNDDYGITMRMMDFNNAKTGPANSQRDTVQTNFFGVKDNNQPGLLTTNLGENGYPTTTDKTGHEESLANLFTDMEPVNQLLLESTYNESGYFEFDSTQNFAHLNEDGTFTVYDQLLAVGTDSGPTRRHGQFLPYNMIDTNVLAPFKNETNVLAKELSDLDPRKGEDLYWVSYTDADYFFGMEMEASFTQTVNGLDAWGHDIIFEFSGDDDFWLYVDGELVLDLGGVHPAMAGSINFRTGQIIGRDGKKTTLYDTFKANYEARGMSAAKVKAKLEEIFIKNVEGNYVFKDYSSHTMKMFYMERGAGASNLHMRFNLAAVKPGTVVLTKNIEGTEKQDYTLAEFPYQIYYKTKKDGDQSAYHLLEQTNEDGYNVTYGGSKQPVKYAETFTPAGGSQPYEHVFFLKPGQSAEISMPEDVVDYYIVECGINPNIYRTVSANGETLAGTDTAAENRKDYATGKDTVENRPRVEYTNEVDPNSLRTLTITKKLLDESGDELSYEDDPTPFSFRLSLGGENDDAPSPAYMHEYQVKDAEGDYCRWDEPTQKFVSLGENDYSKLTEAQRQQATFITSPSGGISKIPADHSIEVRELVVGSKFMVEERDYELPAGYTFVRYDRVQGSYLIDEGDTINSGTIRDNSDPAIQVYNQRGWGITAKKVWSDASFMSDRDPIYLAVFTQTSDGGLTLVEGTVRQLTSGKTSTYWYFDALQDKVKFENHVVREVTISAENPTVAEDGTVSNPGTVTPLERGDSLRIEALQQGDASRNPFEYLVDYTQGDATGAADNVREDTVYNTRSGVRIVKTDMSGNPLADATFKVVDSEGHAAGTGTYTSDADGIVAVAYLHEGSYTLTETTTPEGYVGLTGPLTITKEGDTITVSGVEADEGLYEYDSTPRRATKAGSKGTRDDDGTSTDTMPTITIKNRPFTLLARKVDSEGKPLAGTTFALYRQVKDASGTPVADYSPLPGYDSLNTGDDGVIATDLQHLAPGSYYLYETAAPEGYELPYQQPRDSVCFTIGENGVVTVEQGTDRVLTTTTDDDGLLTYTLTISNEKSLQKLRIVKVDNSDPERIFLAGAVFDLYRIVDDVREQNPLYAGMTSGDDGVVSYEGETVFELSTGVYHLVETKAPDGYIAKTEPVVITVAPSGITYDERTSLSGSNRGTSVDKVEVFTITVSNTGGYELPHTGGAGTTLLYAVGCLALAAGAAELCARHFRRARASVRLP